MAPAPQSAAGAGRSSKWACPMCTLDNESRENVCNACGSPRPVGHNNKRKGRLLRPRTASGLAAAARNPAPDFLMNEDGDLASRPDDASRSNTEDEDEDDDDEDFLATRGAAKKGRSNLGGRGRRGCGRVRRGGSGSGSGAASSKGREPDRGSAAAIDAGPDSADAAGGGAPGRGANLLQVVRSASDHGDASSSTAAISPTIAKDESTSHALHPPNESETRNNISGSGSGSTAAQRPARIMEIDIGSSSSENDSDLERERAGEERPHVSGGEDIDSTGEDDLGETPPLFGRGWSEKHRFTWSAHDGGTAAAANARSRARAGVRAASSLSSAKLRGNKRHRPLPPPPSIFRDNLFSSGIHKAEGTESGSDDERRPLVPPSKRRGGGSRSSTDGGLPWRWPTPPRLVGRPAPASPPSALTDREADAEVSGGDGNINGQEGSLESGATSASAGSQSDARRGLVETKTSSVDHDTDGEGEGQGGEGRSQGEGSPCEDGGVMLAEQSPEDSAMLFSQQAQTQGRYPQRKRSRLSLKRGGGDGRLAKSAKCEQTQSLELKIAEEAVKTKEGGVKDPSAEGDEEVSEEDVSGGKLNAGLLRSVGGNTSSAAGVVEGGERAVWTPKDDTGGSSRSNGNESRPDKRAVDPASSSSASKRRQKHESGNHVDADRTGEKHERTTVESLPLDDQSTSQVGSNPPGDVLDKVLTTRQTSTGSSGGPTVTTQARLPARKGMDVDFGDDSGSSDEDIDDEMKHSHHINGGVHRGQARGEEPNLPSPCGGVPVTVDPFAVTAAAPGALPALQATTPPDEQAVHAPPPRSVRRLGNDENADDTHGDSKRGNSPDPSPKSMGLVDTPPSSPPGASAKPCSSERTTNGSTARRTPRKSLTPRKGSDVMARSDPSSTTTSSVDDPCSQSSVPPAKNQSRGEWACGRCTYLNRARTRKCEICNEPKRIASGGGASSGATPAGPGGGGTSDGSTRKRKAVSDSGRGKDQRGVDTDGEEGNGEGGKGGLEVDRETSTRERKRRAAVESTDDDDGEADDDEKAVGAGVSGRRDNARSRSASSRTRKKNVNDGVDDGDGGGEVGGGADGFVGDVDAIVPDGEGCYGADYGYEYDESDDGPCDEDDDEEWREDGDDEESDGSDTNAELIGSQIEQRLSKVFSEENGEAPVGPRSEKRQRKAPPAGEILDLTENFEESSQEQNGHGSSYVPGQDQESLYEDPLENPRYAVEDISDDDEIAVCPDDDRGRVASGIRKYRFFASVEEHRDDGSSSVDFAKFLNVKGPAAGATYEARRKTRESKKPKKKGRKPAASGRKKVSKRVKPKGRGAYSGNILGRFGARSAASMSGGLPAGAWIPTGIRNSAGASGAGGGGSLGRAAAATPTGGVRRSSARQPFNHYQRSDDVIEDLEGAAGHWEGIGTTTHGD